MEEVWKPVKNYEGFYEVSSHGRIKSFGINKDGKEKIRKLQANMRGYYHCSLSKNGVEKTRDVHQLVAEAFLGHTPCAHNIEVDHINGNRHDNRIENLRLVSHRTNINGYKRNTVNMTSKHRGVHRLKNRDKWTSAIYIQGESWHLGGYDNDIDAANAYQDALINLELNPEYRPTRKHRYTNKKTI